MFGQELLATTKAMTLLRKYPTMNKTLIDKKNTALLADSNRDNLRNMRDCLNQTGRFEILDYAFDGRQALQMIKELEPDLLIIDLVMPRLDCFAVLEALEEIGYRKETKVIVTSVIWLDFVLKKAQSLDVDYVLHKPFEKTFFQRRVCEIMQHQKGSAALLGGGAAVNERAIVTKHIKTVGITANVKGYHYLRDAIIMVRQDFRLMRRLTTDVYVQIAKEYETSPQCVERAIRHAIAGAWNRGDEASLTSFLGFANLVSNRKPSNGELITMLADKLRIELSYSKKVT